MNGKALKSQSGVEALEYLVKQVFSQTFKSLPASSANSSAPTHPHSNQKKLRYRPIRIKTYPYIDIPYCGSAGKSGKGSNELSFSRLVREIGESAAEFKFSQLTWGGAC